MAKQDKRAIRVLFSRYNAQVFRFLMPMVGNQATAEDLVSEFLIEVWRRAAGFEVRSREGTWVLGIARYKALAALRRRPIEQLDAPSADPSRILVTVRRSRRKKDRSVILRRCIERLPPAHRDVIHLAYYPEDSNGDWTREATAPAGPRYRTNFSRLGLFACGP